MFVFSMREKLVLACLTPNPHDRYDRYHFQYLVDFKLKKSNKSLLYSTTIITQL